MKTIIYKLTCALVLALMFANNVSAIDLDITLTKAGDLMNKVALEQLPEVESLKITGDINGTDLLVIRSMSNLKVLDLEKANIVPGGQAYNEYGDTTKTNEISLIGLGQHNFNKIVLPNTVTKIGGKIKDGKIGNLIIGTSASSITTQEQVVDTLTFRCTTIKNWLVGHSAPRIMPQVVVIDDGVEEIESFAFQKCHKGYYSYSANPKYYDTFFTKLIIKSPSITKFGEYAFYNCKDLSRVEIADGVKIIGACAFKDCSSLNDVILSNTLEKIGFKAFAGTGSISNITIPESVVSFGGSIFSSSQVRNVNLPTNITKIPNGMFEDCIYLVRLNLPNSIKSIGDSAFFSNETCYFTFHLPENIESIGNYAFYNRIWTKLNIPRTLMKIGINAFNMNNGEVYFDDFATWYEINTISPLGQLPKNITQILNVYDAGQLLKEITVPKYVSKLRKNLFGGFSGIELFHLHDGISQMDYGAFYGCANLKSIIIPKNITTIPSNAFYGCKKLTSIYIPSKVSNINDYAFSGCTNLTEINVRNPNPPKVSASCFNDVLMHQITLYVPLGSHYLYSIDATWQTVGNIIELPDIGDTNSDGNIDILDVTTLINDVLNGSASNLLIDDINGDGEIDVQDVTALINLILN